MPSRRQADKDVSRYLIYGLVDPFDDELRYVGKSSTWLQRPESHWTDESSLHLDDYCHRWIRAVVERGETPNIVIIQELENCYDIRRQLNETEIYWIAVFRDLGARLTNTTDGGDGISSPMPEEIRKKISKTRKAGKYIPWSKTHSYSLESRQKMRTAKLGKKLSSEHKTNISSGHKRRREKTHGEL